MLDGTGEARSGRKDCRRGGSLLGRSFRVGEPDCPGDEGGKELEQRESGYEEDEEEDGVVLREVAVGEVGSDFEGGGGWARSAT